MSLSYEIDVELDELDGAISCKLADDSKPGDEHSAGDEDAVVGPAGNEFWQLIEAGCEPINDP